MLNELVYDITGSFLISAKDRLPENRTVSVVSMSSNIIIYDYAITTEMFNILNRNGTCVGSVNSQVSPSFVHVVDLPDWVRNHRVLKSAKVNVFHAADARDNKSNTAKHKYRYLRSSFIRGVTFDEVTIIVKMMCMTSVNLGDSRNIACAKFILETNIFPNVDDIKNLFIKSHVLALQMNAKSDDGYAVLIALYIRITGYDTSKDALNNAYGVRPVPKVVNLNSRLLSDNIDAIAGIYDRVRPFLKCLKTEKTLIPLVNAIGKRSKSKSRRNAQSKYVDLYNFHSFVNLNPLHSLPDSVSAIMRCCAICNSLSDKRLQIMYNHVDELRHSFADLENGLSDEIKQHIKFMRNIRVCGEYQYFELQKILTTVMKHRNVQYKHYEL